jgi:prepilin-type N-terminal cleavage/methylation domain-containing protein
MGVMRLPRKTSLPRKSGGRAFTLTELLVVIGVVVLLVAIILTIFHSAIKVVKGFKG